MPKMEHRQTQQLMAYGQSMAKWRSINTTYPSDILVLGGVPPKCLRS